MIKLHDLHTIVGSITCVKWMSVSDQDRLIANWSITKCFQLAIKHRLH